MLQNLNLDVKKSVDINNTNILTENDEMRRSHSNLAKQDLILPVLRNKQNINMNMSADNIKPEENVQENVDNDPYKPRM
jgi:hypothetical protein